MTPRKVAAPMKSVALGLAAALLAACAASVPQPVLVTSNAQPSPKESPAMSHRVLVAVTSHAEKGSTHEPTGAYLAEISHPYAVLREAGFTVDFVSPAGGRVPLDGVDRKDPVNAAFLDDPKALAHLHESVRSSDASSTGYDALFFAGGHGTMWDFPDDAGLQKLASEIYGRGGAVAAVCHGPAGLVNVKLEGGRYLVDGKDVAAFTNEEERAVGLEKVVPFLLSDRLAERGAKMHPGPTWKENVVVSERLVTGQNPASAPGVARALVEVLGGKTRAPEAATK
jgi:putative intracellular protease/amidase